MAPWTLPISPLALTTTTMAEYINEKAGYLDERDGAVTVDFSPWRPRTKTYIDGHTLQAVTVEKSWGEYKLNDGNAALRRVLLLYSL